MKELDRVPRVLLARIRSHLRRLGPDSEPDEPGGLFEIGPLRIDSMTREAMRGVVITWPKWRS